MAIPTGQLQPDIEKQRPRWRGLLLFWAAILVVVSGGAVALQALGPPLHSQDFKTSADKIPVLEKTEPAGPAPAPVRHGEAEPPPMAGRGIAERAAARAPDPPKKSRLTVELMRPGAASAGPMLAPILAPDPELLESGTGPDAVMLPRISADGRIPGQVYARGFTAELNLPRIGLVLAGIGLNTAESMRAIQGLPPGITLAVSPYGAPNPALLNLARQEGHELLLAIPLEPMGYPLNDPGEHALMTLATVEDNKRNLEWALGRFAGYAGVTAALGGQLNGERFASLPDQMRPMLDNLRSRGLFYVDSRMARPSETGQPPAALPYVWNRAVDLVVDDPAETAALEAKLTALEGIARDKGSALGLVGLASPITLDRLAAWSNGLAGRGFVLAPASALMLPPGKVSE